MSSNFIKFQLNLLLILSNLFKTNSIISYSHVLLGVLYLICGYIQYKLSISSIGFLQAELLLFIMSGGVAVIALYALVSLTTLRIAAETYGYSSLKVALVSLYNNAKNVDSVVLLLIAISVVIFIVLGIVTYVLRKKKVFSVNAFKLAAAFVTIFAVGYSVERSSVTSMNLVSTASQWLYYESILDVSENKAVITQSHTALTSEFDDKKKNDTYIFIIESMGVFKDKNANATLQNIFTSIPGANTKSFSFQSTGAGTVGGELRELCGVKIWHSNITKDFFHSPACAPNKFNQFNFNTIAIHGGAYGMFNRPYLYKLMGFREYLASKDLDQFKPCGGGWVSSPCDVSIINNLESLLPPSPRFVYFLSINTHYPYKPITIAPPLDCGVYSFMDETDCTHFSNLYVTLSSIAEFIKRNKGTFYVVGDHAPPTLVRSNLLNSVSAFEISRI